VEVDDYYIISPYLFVDTWAAIPLMDDVSMVCFRKNSDEKEEWDCQQLDVNTETSMMLEVCLGKCTPMMDRQTKVHIDG
jgi:hypothetical protein